MSDAIGLVYTGKVIAIEAIEGADFIACATVVCGRGGKWKGVVRRAETDIGLLVTGLVVDHNHISGKFRGLLCHSCNRGIGLLKENIEIFKRAIKYLDDPYKD